MLNLLKKIKKKYIIIIIISVFILYDIINIGIDLYNFNQLSIVKKVFDSNSQSKYIIGNLIDFNEKYNQSLRPIKDCYYISTYNGKYPYIFGFELHSALFKFIYRSDKYVYPKYDLPYENFCDGTCYDINYDEFQRIISEPCEGSISGYVFHDTNGNGKRDIGEKGVEGMGVLIDSTTIFTDQTGFYSINIRGGDWGHDVQVKYFKHYEYISSPKNRNKSYEEIKVEGRENIQNIDFGAYVHK